MSHSQFHSTDLFILRHAWLNLWDKHMTTGRINQVSYRDCVNDTEATFTRTPTEVVFTWDTHKALHSFMR